MDDLIDTLNEIIATGDNCDLPYISILGRKAKQQAIESIIKRSRNGEYVWPFRRILQFDWQPRGVFNPLPELRSLHYRILLFGGLWR